MKPGTKGLKQSGFKPRSSSMGNSRRPSAADDSYDPDGDTRDHGSSFRDRRPVEVEMEMEALPHRPAPVLHRGTYAQVLPTVQAAPKRHYVRSPKLLFNCCLIPCQHCGREESGTVCGAHSNWVDWGGKGGHIKADDNCIAALCDLCHVPELDQGAKLSRAERRSMWLAAHLRTVNELQDRGLWPADVPVPVLQPD